jgi:hypothetical protein
MKNDWEYLWSIVRHERQGDVYAKWATEFGDDLYKVVLLEDGEEVPTPETTDVENYDLDYCRILAEDFVQGA